MRATSRGRGLARGVIGVIATLLIILASGCGEESPEPPPVSDPEYEGISREEIERRAEPMTPEEAERLGIIDTTIRVEPPMNPDSVPFEGEPEEVGDPEDD